METYIVGLSILIIIGAPWITYPYHLIENIIVRLLICAAVVYAGTVSQFAGLVAFLAAFTLLIERNHQLLSSLPDQQPRGLQTEGEKLMETKPQHPSPQESIKMNSSDYAFEKAEDLEDNNPRLDSASSTSQAKSLF